MLEITELNEVTNVNSLTKINALAKLTDVLFLLYLVILLLLPNLNKTRLIYLNSDLLYQTFKLIAFSFIGIS